MRHPPRSVLLAVAGAVDFVTSMTIPSSRRQEPHPRRAVGVPSGGLAGSNDLSQWLTYKPSDPTGNLAAAWHVHNRPGHGVVRRPRLIKSYDGTPTSYGIGLRDHLRGFQQ